MVDCLAISDIPQSTLRNTALRPGTNFVDVVVAEGTRRPDIGGGG